MDDRHRSTAPSAAPPRRRTRSRTAGALCAAVCLSLVALPPTSATAEVTDPDPSFEVSASDLRFILKQIKISEAHAYDGDLLCASPTDTTGTCVPDPKLPWGLRTVSGIYNNINPGRADFGAADRPFPRLMPEYLWPGRGAGSGSFDIDGPGPAPAVQVTSTGYGDVDVVDGHPRTVSNLVVDQTVANPAAVAAAGSVPGSAVDETTGEIFIPNEAPDEALSAPFNSWMTLFGQFFDHGLDLVNKGGNGSIYVPLNDDDPLVVGNPADPADDLPAGLRFMPLTRATVVGSGPNGERLHNNQTTPYVDQNQTYTSHPSHQVFLREYETSSGAPMSTGRLLDGSQGGLVSWAELKQVTAETLGIELDDMDVLNVPQVQTDLYGQFDPGPKGHPQLVFSTGEEPAGAACVQGDDANTYVLCEGDPTNPVDATGARRTNHAFLDDIAHAAAPRPGGGHNAALLGQHFITGDGRGNENIGLTAVHHVFHAEHNRTAGVIADVVAATPSLDAAYRSTEPTSWGYGARLFQAARYVTEMQYQHLVFEEFARTLSPTIDPAPFNESTYHPTIDAAIPAEFAHTVYRFGHSMLTDTIARRGFGATDIGLIEGFLNPAAFTMNGTLTPDQGAGSIINGMVAQTGNGIDEFVVEALRNKLLGLPLDLASINLARAREAGVPPLQEVRRLFFEESGDPALQPYADWNDFGAALKHPASLRNLIAAYAVDDPAGGTPLSIADRRAQADTLMADPAFMSSAQGLDGVDLWMGGLAEAGMPFGGMLGTTFNHIFERTLENLQNGDRFYYLNRNIGLNLFHQLEANSFSALVQRTTAASEVPTNIFASQDGVVYDLEVIAPAVEAGGELPAGLTRMNDGTYRYIGEDHIQMHGQRSAADRMRADIGDDALWGYAGDDRIEGEEGNDQLVGGSGDDVLTDLFGDDNIKGSKGNDAIHAGPGLDLIHGGAGNDFIVHGQDDTQTFAGQGNDLMLGGAAHDIFAGNEGDDWLEGAGGSDLLQGDNANGFQDDPYGGNDVLISGLGNDDHDSEGGDDIMVTDPGTDRHEGMLGFDWVTHKDDPDPANADMDNTVFAPPSVQNLRDRYDLVEALSGWDHDDVLRGFGSVDVPPAILGDEVCADFGRPAGCTGHELTESHLDMITGLRDLLAGHAAPFMADNTTNDILIGGGGSDTLEGRGGDDFIDGSAWLNVGLEHDGQRYEDMGELRAAVFSDGAGRVNPGDISIVREILVAAEDGVNMAVFSGAEDEYAVTQNPDGTLTVSHDGGTGADGTDTLRNIARLSFTDGVFDVAQLLNTAATGVVTLSTADPAEGTELTADASTIADADGLGALTITWQAGNETDGFVAVGEGASFTPTAAEIGLQLRAVVTFVDGDGVPEQVVSDVTGPVADDPAIGGGTTDPGTGGGTGGGTVDPGIGGGTGGGTTDPGTGGGTGGGTTDPGTGGGTGGGAGNTPATGTASIAAASGARILSVSTASIVDPDGVGALSFQWQVAQQAVARARVGGFADIPGATAATLKVTDGLRGREVRVRVSYVDGAGTPEQVVSDAVPVPTTRAGAPAIRKVVAGAPGGRTTAAVKWSTPGVTGGLPVSGYRVIAVQVRKNGTVVGRDRAKVGADVHALVMRLEPGRYRFTVRALNEHGAGPAAATRVVRAR